MLTDTACSNLAYSVPHLEFLELAGIRTTCRDDGLVRLLCTAPLIRKLDLEDACYNTDAVLEALTPVDAEGSASSPKTAEKSPRPGQALRHMTVSSAANMTNPYVQSAHSRLPEAARSAGGQYVHICSVLKEFVRLACERNMRDAELVIMDCQSVGRETRYRERGGQHAPRKGWHSW